jgi:uncharacterized protein (DUF2062 family)
VKERFAHLFRTRFLRPVIALIRKGISPHTVALSLAVGAMLGLFPVPGTTTLLCTSTFIIFRLNFPAMQIMNWVVWPLQVALMIPYFKLGSYRFFPWGSCCIGDPFPF